MTHPSHQTNGASLEDCHTNFFALTDLCGIKWRKLVWGEVTGGFGGTPLEDPVLSSFSRCLAGDILCVWRRVASTPSTNTTGTGGLYDVNIAPSPAPPPLSLTAAKELWIFWYGEEPDLSGLVSPELISCESEQGSWESGLSYECRSLLFKALHNLIERCLLSRDFVRLGKWFVQPYDGFEKHRCNSSHLSFSFAFFVHGESTVCASVDVRQHPAVRHLTRTCLQRTQTMQNSVKVILAPYGLAGTLTGQVGRIDSQLLDEWKHFYPINSNNVDSGLPTLVEVLVGGVRMRYPSCYVLVTDMDDVNIELPLSPPYSPATTTYEHPNSIQRDTKTSTELPERVWAECTVGNNYHSNIINEPASPDFGNWTFVDATQKSSCTCSKCTTTPGGWKGINSSSQVQRERVDKSGRRNVVPFHRRSTIQWESSCPSVPTNTPRSAVSIKTEAPNTPPGGPPSYPRGPPTGGDCPPVPSVGSPSSPAPSPLPTPHSEPASVPPSSTDLTMPTLSPQPPPPNHAAPPLNSSSSTSSSSSQQQQQPQPQPPQQQQQSQPQQQQQQQQGPKLIPPPGCNNNQSASSTQVPSLKRPILSSREYEGALIDDEQPLSWLYDYSSLEAWFNHPVKKFKGNTSVPSNQRCKSLYPQNDTTNNQSQIPKMEIKQEPGTGDCSGRNDPYEFDINIDENGSNTNADGIHRQRDDQQKPSSLFTSEGLQASYKDLDQIFDNSDPDTSSDETNLNQIQIQTPPGSNKSTVHNDEQRFDNNTKNYNSRCILRPEELSKMFPTPPSLEHNPVASPCQLNDTLIEQLDINILQRQQQRILPDIYPNMGSPQEEQIDDWNYVFKPPLVCKLVGSSKYAPLTNLPSQLLPPISLPSNCIYRPSWQCPTTTSTTSSSSSSSSGSSTTVPSSSTGAAVAATSSSSSSSSSSPPSTTTTLSTTIATTPSSLLTDSKIGILTNNNNNQLRLQQQNQQLSNIIGSQVHLPILQNTLQQNSHHHHHHQQQQQQHHHQQQQLQQQLHHQQQQQQQQLLHNLPSSPAQSSSYRVRPPPPPYDQPSPATSTTSSYLNKNINSIDTIDTPGQQNRFAETNSLIVNILLGDTALNIFRDHNFDSCSLCVCNAGPKVVGNIKGADAGIYITTNNLNNIGYNNDDDQIRCSCGFSAVINRKLSHKSGLFYEDEMEITGIADDPADFKKISLVAVCGNNDDYNTNNNSNNNNNGNNNNNNNDNSSNNNNNSNSNNSGEGNSGGSVSDGNNVNSNNSNNNSSNSNNNNTSGTNSNNNSNSSNSNSNNGSKTTNTNDDTNQIDNIPINVLEILREQCAIVQSSVSSLYRASRVYACNRNNMKIGPTLNTLEYNDGNDVSLMAIDQGKIIDGIPYDKTNRINGIHKWGFIRAKGPQCSGDIVRIMRSLQPLLQEAVQRKCTTRMWEAPYTVAGPLTWRQFHRLAGRGTDDRCEPQPIPAIVVGYDRDWLSLAPHALNYWEKLMLEPYSGPRDIAYIVLTPDNDAVINRVKNFFRELSTTYDICRLGKHIPITKTSRDGIIRVGKNSCQNYYDNKRQQQQQQQQQIDEWFKLLGDNKMSEQLRHYAQVCCYRLAPYLTQVIQDRSLLDNNNDINIKKEQLSSSLSSQQSTSNVSPETMPSTPDGITIKSEPIDDNSQSSGTTIVNNSNSNSTNINNLQNSSPGNNNNNNNNNTNNQGQNINGNGNNGGNTIGPDDDEIEQPSIVVYIVEPFTLGGPENIDKRRLAILALLRAYSNAICAMPENIRSNINVQLISLESIMELGRARERRKIQDELRSLALNVFLQGRRLLNHNSTVKSLTGFGTAAAADIFLKNKDERNRAPYRLYAPAYVLAPLRAKSEAPESFGIAGPEECAVLYLSYCLSEDQSRLLAVATDDRGEIFETAAINIDVPNRKRRKRVSARRIGLQKLMDFILGVMSQGVQPWRLVVGRVGRIGHGELKGWSWLLSRKSLSKASKHLKEICGQCNLLYPSAAPCVLSACLVSLEPDSTLRLMADQFTPDERFSQASVNCQLSTPQDVTCTHILVFPTSATTQSSQTAFQEQHINGPELGDDELFSALNDDMPEGMEGMGDFNDIFNVWPEAGAGGGQSPGGSPHRPEGSPLGGDGGGSGMGNHDGPGSPFPCSNTPRAVANDQAEEVGTLLQQPLALGYLVSTAPTGRMPPWFWSACPHLEGVCPAFLKNALHLHSPAIQQNSDDLLQQQSALTAHPLDSQYTTDVLRYVLEGYNALSWLAVDSNTRDRLSCLPVHIQALMQLYHASAALV